MENLQPAYEVLDKGYVRLREVTGNDLTVVNSARVSYDKRSEVMSLEDEKLIRYLATHGHTSPFRHAFLTFEVYAPLMVARQWWKYVSGSGHDEFVAWNESSRRYVTENVEFYLPKPNEWREAPENSKQGSGGIVDQELGEESTKVLLEQQIKGLELYEKAMEQGICAEQARLFLPAYGLYVRWVWSGSLQGVAHLINQRVAHDAQKEFQEFAKGVYQIASEQFPVSLPALLTKEVLDKCTK